MATCTNGHANPDTSSFCSICGQALIAPPAQAATAQSESPAAAQPPVAQATGADQVGVPSIAERRSLSRTAWILIIGGIVLVLLVALLAVRLLAKPTGPMSMAQARGALLTSSELGLPFVVDTDKSTLESTDEFDPGSSPACLPLMGVGRLGDIDPGMPLGTPVFPTEARGIVAFEGVDFADTSEDVVSSFDERVLVFASDADAAAYTDTIAEALNQCPKDVIISDTESFSMTSDNTYSNAEVSANQLSWDLRSRITVDDPENILDFDFSASQGSAMVRRGPNVLVASWYRDDDDSTPISQFENAIQAAISKFNAAPTG